MMRDLTGENENNEEFLPKSRKPLFASLPSVKTSWAIAA
jgi:hypothetical protein